jgi:hypothetical protein
MNVLRNYIGKDVSLRITLASEITGFPTPAMDKAQLFVLRLPEPKVIFPWHRKLGALLG